MSLVIHQTDQEQMVLRNALQEAQGFAYFKRSDVAHSWEDDAWDLNPILTSGGDFNGIVKFVHAKDHSSHPDDPLPDFYIDLMKLVVAHAIEDGLNESTPALTRSSMKTRLILLRKFFTFCANHNVTSLKPVSAAQLEEFCKTTPNKLVSNIKTPIEKLITLNIAPHLSGAKLKGYSTAGGDIDYDKAKMIDWEDCVCTARLFYLLEQSVDDGNPLGDRADFDLMRFWGMVAQLFMMFPERLNEIMLQTKEMVSQVNPRTFLDPADQHKVPDYAFGVVWDAEKGGGCTIRPIHPELGPIARRAIEVIKKMTEPARKAAQYIMDNEHGENPMPIIKEFEHIRACRETGRISVAQVQELFGAHPNWYLTNDRVWKDHFRVNTGKTALTPSGVKITRGGRKEEQGGLKNPDATLCFKTFQQDWLRAFKAHWKKSTKQDWPIACVKPGGVEILANNYLMIVNKGLLDNGNGEVRTQSLFLETAKTSMLGVLLKKSVLRETFWERLHITRADTGAYPSITSHQYRHFLNTCMASNNVPELIIAAVSGRKNIAQNAVYNHVDPEELTRPEGPRGTPSSNYGKVDLFVDLKRGTAKTLEGYQGDDIPSHMAIEIGGTYEEERARRANLDIEGMMSVSFTPRGGCMGDLSYDPCPTATEGCLSCARFIGCTADKASIQLLKSDLKSEKGMLKFIKKAKKADPYNDTLTAWEKAKIKKIEQHSEYEIEFRTQQLNASAQFIEEMQNADPSERPKLLRSEFGYTDADGGQLEGRDDHLIEVQRRLKEEKKEIENA